MFFVVLGVLIVLPNAKRYFCSLSGQAIESPAEAIPSQDALTPDETAPVNEESAPEPPSIL